MFCYKKYEQPNRKQDNDDSQEDKRLFEDAPKWLRVTMIILISFCLGFYISIEYCHFDYLVSYSQYIPLKMSAQDGVFLQSIMAAMYTGFRSVGIVMAFPLQSFVHSKVTILWPNFWQNLILGSSVLSSPWNYLHSKCLPFITPSFSAQTLFFLCLVQHQNWSFGWPTCSSVLGSQRCGDPSLHSLNNTWSWVTQLGHRWLLQLEVFHWFHCFSLENW